MPTAHTIFNTVLSILLLIAPFAVEGYNQTGLDPIYNFCKRYQHQSAITSNTLFIDGGTMWFHDPILWGNATPGINTYLIATDMSKSWEWRNNTVSQTLINKTREADRTTGYVPSLNKGALWPNTNQTYLYLYGGTVNSSLSGFRPYTPPKPDNEVLWRYDIAKEFWQPITNGTRGITRASYGGSVVVPRLNKAYYLGGILDQGSTNETGNLSSPRFLDGMLEFDFDTESLRNISTDGLGNRARAYSEMVYIPGYGSGKEKQGILVVIGGEVKDSQLVDVGNNRRGDPVVMSEIAIFDIASETWHVQPASGKSYQIPQSRTDHCIVVASAPDNSSHNIRYLYGGANFGQNRLLDDAWILSLPSFQWIKIFEGQSPRYGMTCHITPQGRQMITVGGLGDVYTANMKDSNCDWELKSVAVYDLTNLTWSSIYHADFPPYSVPIEVVQYIGGTPQGFANITAPLYRGWATQEIKELFVNEPSPKPNTGAITGGILGGITGLCILAVIFRYAYRARIPMMDTPIPPAPHVEGWVKPELEATVAKTEPGSDNGRPIAYHEVGEVGLVEAPAGEVHVELPAGDILAELPAGETRAVDGVGVTSNSSGEQTPSIT
ncbi:hypothetical protein TWF718_008561 [Orbilia javanica]|uniref:Kelch repeat-containing protein n=1 Tax=Orbilia javanica TaxID=47235 RepID=A0AAN8NRH0_9PEZI